MCDSEEMMHPFSLSTTSLPLIICFVLFCIYFGKTQPSNGSDHFVSDFDHCLVYGLFVNVTVSATFVCRPNTWCQRSIIHSVIFHFFISHTKFPDPSSGGGRA